MRGASRLPPRCRSIPGASAARLGEAVQIQTISHQDPAENQAAEWTRLHTWLQTSYPAAHAAMTARGRGGNSLIYSWPGSDPALPPIILMAHQDVVPVSAGTEARLALSAVFGDDCRGCGLGPRLGRRQGLAGRPVRGGGTARQVGFRPKRTILIVSGHDEEVGGSGAQAVAALLKQRGVKALFTLDEGSAVISDAPMIDGPAIMLAVAEKGYATLQLTAKATGGHSSMPPEAIGTVDLAKAVVAIHADQFPKRLAQPVLGTVQTLAARKGGALTGARCQPLGVRQADHGHDGR